MAARLTAQECAAVRAEYDAGSEVLQIADRRNLSRDQVYLRLRRAGTNFRNSGPRPAEVGATHTIGSGYIREKVAEDWPYLAQMRVVFNDGRRRNWVFQHRKVMADALGRALRSDESVHHIDGDKTNNNLDNLQLMQAHPGGGHYRCNNCGSADVSAAEI